MRSGSNYLLKFTVIFTFVMVLVVVLQLSSVTHKPPEELAGVVRPFFKRISTVQLTDHAGARFDSNRFKNVWSFVFFGYTSCPDICPATLVVLNNVVNNLQKEAAVLAENSQVVFVSVDPLRDNEQKLEQYVGYFNKEFIGLTGDKPDIDAVTKQFGAGYMFEAETAPGQYLVNHTSAIFLVDPDARLVATFSQPHIPDTIVAQYKKIREYLAQK